MPVKDELILTDKITEEQIKNGLADTVYDYNQRKEFQYLNIVKKLNDYNIKRYQLSYYPTLSLTGSYNKNAQRNTFDFFGPGDWYTTSYLALNIAIPIFDGFYKDSKVKQSRFELQQTVNNIDNLKLSIDNDVDLISAQSNYISATYDAVVAKVDYYKAIGKLQ